MNTGSGVQLDKFDGVIGTYAPTVLKPVLGPSADMVSDIFGTMGGEVISNGLKTQ
jgi:filamentous hemagglutinin